MHQAVIIGIHEGSVRGREYKKVQKPPIQDVLNPWEPLFNVSRACMGKGALRWGAAERLIWLWLS